MQKEVWGSAVSSPNRVWGRAPAEIELGAFYPYNMTFGGSNFTNLPESYCDFSMQLTHFRFYLHKCKAPLGARPKAGASLASPKGRHCRHSITEDHSFPLQIFPNFAGQFAKFCGKLWSLSDGPCRFSITICSHYHSYNSEQTQKK